MRKNILLFFLCCCTAASLYAQQRLPLPDADAIGYDKDGYWIDIYTKVGDDRYAQRRLLMGRKKDGLGKTSNMDMIDWDLTSVEDTLSRTEIEKDGKRIIDANDLRSVSIENYVGKTFDIGEEGKWKREKENTCYVLKFLRSDLAVVQQLFYGKISHYMGDQFTKSAFIPDSVTTWRAFLSEQLLPLVLGLKGGKNVLLFYYRNFGYMLLPTTKGDRLLKSHNGLQAVSMIPAGGKYDGSAPYDFQYFHTKSFFGIQETAEGKCRLLNAFGQNVLKRDYDSIVYENRFIIAKSRNALDVYNLYLKKLNVGAARVVREINDCEIGCIEVLNEDGACYYDEMGQKIETPTKIWLAVCGTVPHWTHSLLKKQGRHQLQIYTNGPGTPCEEDERYVLSDCQPSDSVSFLNGEKEFSRNGNSWFLGEIDIRPEWIKVGRNGKFGIIAYDYKQPEDAKPKKTVRRSYDWEKEILTYPVQNLTGETILPMVYDSITMRPDGLIYFYKDGKTGLYPLENVPVYDELEQRTRSFYHIIKNGVSGWLDIKTNKEYFFPIDCQ